MNRKKGRRAALVRCLDPLRVRQSAFVFSSTAVGPMANAGGVTRLMRWGHGEPLSESWVASLPWAWKRAYSGGVFHKSRGRRDNVPTASASLTLAREVVKPEVL